MKRINKTSQTKPPFPARTDISELCQQFDSKICRLTHIHNQRSSSLASEPGTDVLVPTCRPCKEYFHRYRNFSKQEQRATSSDMIFPILVLLGTRHHSAFRKVKGFSDFEYLERLLG